MEPLSILFGAVFTIATAYAIGARLFGKTLDEWPVRLITGAAILSTIVFLLCAAGMAYRWVFLLLGMAGCGLAWDRIPRPQVVWKLSTRSKILIGFLIMFFVLYCFGSMAPESSPDGVTYHLGLVSRYLREHGFHRITWNMYASLSEGMEMLFLFAFAFGKHSAASMVHFAFLLALAWQIFVYGRKVGFPLVGGCAALLVFASPMVGIDASSAYNDVGVAAAAFCLFYLIQAEDEKSSINKLIAIGLCAGFCYAIKYTAWPAIAYAIGMTMWRTRRLRSAAIVAVSAGLIVAPWMIKDWVWLQNPVAPFYNRYFPNPFVTVSFEDGYRKDMEMYDLTSRKQIPLAVTTSGTLGGLLGPIFLLAPIGLLSLRRREGRQLLLAAAVFGCNYFSNISPRFLILPLPFIALAMCLALSAVPDFMLAMAVVHAVISWPAYIPRYCAPSAWRLTKVPYREALRLKKVDEYLNSHVFDYGVEKMVERCTAPGARVFTFHPIPEAYTSRTILVNYQAAENQIIGLMIQQAAAPQWMPTWRLRFSFSRRELMGIRLTQTNTAGDLWNIHELRIFDGARELPRDLDWRLTAQPYPWTIQDAFDNSLVTLWRCGETARPGQYVRVDFHQSESADSVLMESAPDQPGIRLKLEGRDASGNWVTLSDNPTISDAPAPLGLRRATIVELKRRGVDYILSFPDESETQDLRANSEIWGVRLAGENKETKLFQLP